MNGKLSIAIVAACAGCFSMVAFDASALPRGRGGGGAAARSSVHAGGGHAAAGAHAGTRASGAPVNRPTNANHANQRTTNTNVDRNTDVNRNTNVNVDRDVNIDVDNGWDNDIDHPWAAAAAVGTAAAVTAAAIGSIVYSVPSGCVTTVVNGIAYQQCGSTWYEPQYAGSSVQYVVVSPP
ncbi:hypothetical protein LK996_00340 [Lysobacter sp. A6]|uniref:Uncharacterized protein n=1 Tax=Noviluteimonas lactosilytica TaxID=2888523 RepID=A0ABS8JD56_9GAMM|nr:hypothetical protein [Lysobacter lactosilyticus]MCC8361535.1 hypothetical protein [Lysobacter lactosilyticus]